MQSIVSMQSIALDIGYLKLIVQIFRGIESHLLCESMLELYLVRVWKKIIICMGRLENQKRGQEFNVR